jgi:hypothetical protein
MPVISALRMLRQEDCELQANLDYIVRPCQKKKERQREKEEGRKKGREEGREGERKEGRKLWNEKGMVQTN